MEVVHPLKTELSRLKECRRLMEFDPEKESFKDWQAKGRQKLAELLGMSRFEKCDDCFEIEGTEHCEGFDVTRFTFCSEKDAVVVCNLVVPQSGAGEKLPLMICLQGHGTGMHISLGIAKHDIDVPKLDNGDRDFALQCVERNICALTLEQRCFGERGGNPRPDCHGASLTALLTGRTMIGGRVWDVMCAIDEIEKHFSHIVDTEKIFCMGNSGGGTATIYAFALENRIKASVPSCAFCTFADSIGELNHCVCNYVPHIAEYFDMAEIAGLGAPRPIVIVSGAEDGIFPLSGAESEFARLRKIYEGAGAPNACVHVIGEGGHRFYAEKAWPEFRKFAEV